MKRIITSVVRIARVTSGGWPIDPPLRIVSLCGCVHHIVSNEEVGTSVECGECGDVAAGVEKARVFMASPLFSHVTERSTAMNGDPSWTNLNFYRFDETSPTKCVLEFAAPCCDEVRAVIAEFGKRALLGPTRGQFAKL